MPVAAAVVSVPASVTSALVHVNVSSAQLLAEFLPFHQLQVLPCRTLLCIVLW